MSQNIQSSRNTQTINAPFRIKSAGISLFTILLIGSYYVANMLNLLPSDLPVPDGALSLTITTVILIVIVEVVLQIVLFIGAGQVEDHTERDNSVAARAARNAYYVMTVGTIATFGSMFAGFSQFEMANVLLLAFLIAEIVKYLSQLFYHRR